MVSEAGHQHWTGSWTTSPALVDEARIENRTLRMIMRPSLAGKTIRLRFSNAHGSKPVNIVNVSIARRTRDAEIDINGARAITFGGSRDVRIPAGALALSDSVNFNLSALSDVAVSFYVPGSVNEVTGHKTARQTNYVSQPGDFSQWPDMPVESTTESWYFSTGIEVLAAAETKGIVCLGDSLTDGNISTVDANMRWPDQLARRLVAAHGPGAFGVINQGIGGNRLLHDLTGDSMLRRFDRDVLAQPGATHLILLGGVNDLRNRRGNADENTSAPAMMFAMTQIARRAKAAGLKAYAGTLLPYEKESFYEFGWTQEREGIRLAVNAWLRKQKEFDGLIDFDKAMRDPAALSKLKPDYDCGDHLHPSDIGYARMGDLVFETLFA
jgi:lysophospholipase L1-like esterase